MTARNRRPGQVPARQTRPAPSVENPGPFAAVDWLLTVAIAVIWGSSFLWIAVSLRSFSPAAVGFGRFALGFAVVVAFPGARQPVGRAAWPAIAVVAVAGNAAPAVMVAAAQQNVESSVAGIFNAATPLAVVAVAAAARHSRTTRRHLAGLAVGFAGVVVIAAPAGSAHNMTLPDIVLLLGAMLGFAVAYHVILPLQRAHGTLPVVARALGTAAAALVPFGAHDLVTADVDVRPGAALAMLGVFSTGAGRCLDATLIGRVGPARSSVLRYLVPVVAVALGVAVLDETLTVHETIGAAAVLVGAVVVSRSPAATRRTP